MLPLACLVIRMARQAAGSSRGDGKVWREVMSVNSRT